MGHEADDPAATYAMLCPLAMFWPYTSEALMIGEDVYQLAPFTIVKPDPSDIFTFDERSRMLGEFIGDLAELELA
jgi:hypothetical protein